MDLCVLHESAPIATETDPKSIEEALRPLGDVRNPDHIVWVTEWEVPSGVRPPLWEAAARSSHDQDAEIRCRALNAVIARLNASRAKGTKRIPKVEYRVPRSYVCLRAEADVSPQRREHAARRLAKLFPNPVHPRRWARVRAALADQARLHGRTVEQELFMRIVAAAFEVLPKVRFSASFFRSPNEAEIRSELNRIVTEDVLGTKSHRRFLSMDLAEDARAPETHHRNFEILRAVEQAGLTAKEHEVLSAFIERSEGQREFELARGLGISHSSFRTHLHNARKKVRASI